MSSSAAWATGSVAVLASLADTALDVIASLVTLFGVRVAAMPAEGGNHYYFEIMLPGSILGAVVGWATQKYGQAAPRATAS